MSDHLYYLKAIIMGNLFKIVVGICLITLLVIPAMAVSAENDTLKLPSPVRGWSTAPGEAKTWAQTILDWGAMVAGIVAIGVLLFHFIKGRVADTTGSIQDRNESTSKMIQVVVGAILLVISIAFVWQIFWK